MCVAIGNLQKRYLLYDVVAPESHVGKDVAIPRAMPPRHLERYLQTSKPASSPPYGIC